MSHLPEFLFPRLFINICPPRLHWVYDWTEICFDGILDLVDQGQVSDGVMLWRSCALRGAIRHTVGLLSLDISEVASFIGFNAPKMSSAFDTSVSLKVQRSDSPFLISGDSKVAQIAGCCSKNPSTMVYSTLLQHYLSACDSSGQDISVHFQNMACCSDAVEERW